MDHGMRAHLLPKLRCQFAEFLNQSSLTRLGILTLPTCVGLRYGQHMHSTRGFSWKHGITSLEFRRTLAIQLSGYKQRVYSYAAPLQPFTDITMIRWAILLRPRSLQCTYVGAGILTRLPIDYASRPRLRSRLTHGGFSWPWKP